MGTLAATTQGLSAKTKRKLKTFRVMLTLSLLGVIKLSIKKKRIVLKSIYDSSVVKEGTI